MSSPTTILSEPRKSNDTQSVLVPPGGGDTTLMSSDGVEFLVHSTHLKLASSVFADMLTVVTEQDTVELTEDAIALSYLLRFIYPNRLPLTIGPDVLPICLAVVQKYDIGGALDLIDELIALDTSPHKLLSSDPIRIYQLARQFNLVKTKAVAAPLITADRVDFCDLDKVQEFAQKYSAPRLVSLMNIQAMRAKVLSDILFKFDSKPVRPTESMSSLYWGLSCVKCRTKNKEDQRPLVKILPSWVLAWVRLVYETLNISSEPIAKTDYLFESSILEKFKGREDVCQLCLSDFAKYPGQGPKFNLWAKEIKKVLEAQLTKLELVYAL
ncbi:hypothetical protein RSOLAG1IB_03254 [Rhizoctonia solani AG-1 IB]|uniref:BTB domain-containing protein n=2 Tax=Thanatephorus cucumeris (strain AG1-IB / isolate 7/3/14) TaxID=1108050 RepID=A0A0B7FMY2_THACB|nr:hypothetical protein RSOLAG1IB_03254 [Rhizoctonia solani AG-1 IB]